MKKLTADTARALLARMKENESNAGLTIRDGYMLQALEIALPALEQKPHESVIAEQLEAVMNSMTLDLHQTLIIGCAIDRLNELSLRIKDLSRPVLEQEGGWISCNDRLPDSKEIVIIFDGRDVGQGRIDIVSPAGVAPGNHLGSPIGFFSIPDPWGETRCNPVAWKPLPAPPKPQPSITPQIDNDGWIDWGGGGECPVSPTQPVDVKFRNGEVNIGQSASGWAWHRAKGVPGDYDIIAYRVIENDGREG